jgi:hypothetical protein
LDDESIFAWNIPGENMGGLLAHSSIAFKNSRDIIRGDWESTSSSMTNKGLRMELNLIELGGLEKSVPGIANDVSPDTYFASINCKRTSDLNKLGIILEKIHGNKFIRSNSELTSWCEHPSFEYQRHRYELVYVRQDRDIGLQRDNRGCRNHVFWIYPSLYARERIPIRILDIYGREDSSWYDRNHNGSTLKLCIPDNDVEAYSAIGLSGVFGCFVLFCYVHVDRTADVEVMTFSQYESFRKMKESFPKEKIKISTQTNQDQLEMPKGWNSRVYLTRRRRIVADENQTVMNIRS